MDVGCLLLIGTEEVAGMQPFSIETETSWNVGCDDTSVELDLRKVNITPNHVLHLRVLSV